MIWTREDLPFLRKQVDFCVTHGLKGLPLRQSGLKLLEIIKNVEGKDTKGTTHSKVIVRWC